MSNKNIHDNTEFVDNDQSIQELSNTPKNQDITQSILHAQPNEKSKTENNKSIFKKTFNWCGKTITLESGMLARNTDGSVLISCGETSILTTLVFSKKIPTSYQTFLPLSVNYREMFSASGKIPNQYGKRESKATDNEILISRIIDRTIRSTFDAKFNQEIQIISTVLSCDNREDTSVMALISTAASLAISGIPTTKIVTGVRIGLKDDQPVFFPSINDSCLQNLNMIVSGSKTNITMVEAEACEIKEEKILEILSEVPKILTPIIEIIEEMQQCIGKERSTIKNKITDKIKTLKKTIISSDEIKKLHTTLFHYKTKEERKKVVHNIQQNLEERYASDEITLDMIDEVLSEEFKKVIRENILKNNIRIDNRNNQQIRDITSSIGLLKRCHGSAVFTRGKTQALSTVTLGSEDETQIVHALSGIKKENFILHYSFHPYSTSEISPLKAPNRREINHGYLALKALSPIMPNQKLFPYTIRVTSEILEANGSTSQATICASTLALMDAGVPIKKMVSGIAMGLIKENNQYVILSDIATEEDNAGDMDFKIAGTKDGITAMQMDVKDDNIPMDVLQNALFQARDGRLHILNEMTQTITQPKAQISEYAPVFGSITISQSSIKSLIGVGGKVIKELCEITNSKINVQDDGKVNIFAQNNIQLKQTIQKIQNITANDIELGKKIQAKVVKIIKSGCFVKLSSSKDGFIHISEITDEHVDDIRDHLQPNQEINAVIIKVENDQIRLSIKQYDTFDINNQRPKKPFTRNVNMYNNKAISTYNRQHSNASNNHDARSRPPQRNRHTTHSNGKKIFLD